MDYLRDRADAYADPRHVLEGVRSIVVLAMPYRTTPPAAAGPGMGRVSIYAWGRVDYHDLIRARLAELAALVRDAVPGARTRGVVDTAPLMERQFAQQAGLGWLGKNTLLLNRQAGSWFFLAALLTDAELQLRHGDGNGPLRDLPRLPRRLSHRCVSTSLCPRRPPLHQLSDD